MGERTHRWHLVVDGEGFEVRDRLDQPGTYDFTWLTGPDPGYGFTIRVHGGGPLSPAQLRREARDFLDQVDPGTGHIG